MTSVDDELAEIEANFEAFSKAWRVERSSVEAALLAQKPVFLRSYQRIVSLHAWRIYFLQGTLSEGSLAFFLEAQNDALVSHVLAQQGCWRVALKALRSCIENVLSALYYNDHPVELVLWHRGSHRLGFSELLHYFEAHPVIADVAEPLTGLAMLKAEFGTLSRAVHGSAKGFRMTSDGSDIMLWSSAKDRVGPWSTREGAVLSALNALLLSVHSESLKRTAFPGLRRAIGRCIPATLKAKYKKSVGVTIP